MPVSKHSHSGTMSCSAMKSANCCTLSTGLSKIIGGQAQVPFEVARR